MLAARVFHEVPCYSAGCMRCIAISGTQSIIP
jgi:hypothetical protein